MVQPTWRIRRHGLSQPPDWAEVENPCRDDWKRITAFLGSGDNHPALYTPGSFAWFACPREESGQSPVTILWEVRRETEPVLMLLAVKNPKDCGRCLGSQTLPMLVRSRGAGDAEYRLLGQKLDAFLDVADSGLILWDELAGGVVSPISRHLLRRGARAEPVFSQVLDLSPDPATLRAGIRKSYGSLINWGVKNFEIRVLSGKKVSWSVLEEFRELHFREAGRVTRPEASWRCQLRMLEDDEAFLVYGYLKGALVAAGFFPFSRTNCHYGSSASRRDLFEKPIFHGLLWSAVLEAKRRGCRWFEFGEQVFPGHPVSGQSDAKAAGISLFKSGFGGDLRYGLRVVLEVKK